MKVLVLGGTNFIGPAAVRCLAAGGHSVAVFHRGKSNAELPDGVVHILGDRANLGDFRGEFAAFGPDVVLDMRPLRESDAVAVMETFRGLARRVVAISSCDVYRAYGILGGTETGEPVPAPASEDAPLRTQLYPYREKADGPDDFRYWYDKIPAEAVFMGDPTLPGTVLRLPMVYGPGDYQHRLHHILKRIDDGRRTIMMDEAMARWRACRGFVDNVGAAIALAVTDGRAANRIYNVAEPAGYSEAEWTRLVGGAAGWDGDIVTMPDNELPPHLREDMRVDQDLTVDTTRIRSELGYSEAITMEEALARTIAWERANPPAGTGDPSGEYAAEDAVLVSKSHDA